MHNKMRCATGADPIKWNGLIQCQAQKSQDEIGAFEHSHSYDLPISVGENLATGTDVSTAAWMWFLEYLNSDDYTSSGDTGHFTAMAWRAVKTFGCGIQRSGKGVIRCQYSSGSSTAPNMQGSYSEEIPPYHGSANSLSSCGLPVSDVKSQAEMQMKWGILNPTGTMKSNIGLYSAEKITWAHSSSVSSLTAGAFAAAAGMIIVGLVVRLRRSRLHHASDLEEADTLIPIE
jgi:hypothetical protein